MQRSFQIVPFHFVVKHAISVRFKGLRSSRDVCGPQFHGYDISQAFISLVIKVIWTKVTTRDR